jgi:hypothetical protein
MTEIDDKAAVAWCDHLLKGRYLINGNDRNAARAALKWRQEAEAAEYAVASAKAWKERGERAEARIAELEAERDRWAGAIDSIRAERDAIEETCIKAEKERDAAIKRAEEVEEAMYDYWLNHDDDYCEGLTANTGASALRKFNDLCNAMAQRKAAEARHE